MWTRSVGRSWPSSVRAIRTGTMRRQIARMKPSIRTLGRAILFGSNNTPEVRNEIKTSG
jgi:hypothetical protein